ncbi:unnamed protein product [Amoebophrya sp. A25]|nr:unnamed protein product [Amoebophrya sp. A25]|eukprot:GSA25T00002927001.1
MLYIYVLHKNSTRESRDHFGSISVSSFCLVYVCASLKETPTAKVKYCTACNPAKSTHNNLLSSHFYT